MRQKILSETVTKYTAIRQLYENYEFQAAICAKFCIKAVNLARFLISNFTTVVFRNRLRIQGDTLEQKYMRLHYKVQTHGNKNFLEAKRKRIRKVQL